jgi:transposase
VVVADRRTPHATSANTGENAVSGRSSPFQRAKAVTDFAREGGGPPPVDRGLCKQRNTVERCTTTSPSNGAALAARYDKTATIHLAGIFIWSAR